MTEAQFAAFRQQSLASYTEDLLRDGGYTSRKEAEEEARSEFAELLPQGLATPKHFLLQILNEANESVGYLWYDQLGLSKAFLDDLCIYPPYRRQGYALSALQLMEKTVPLPHITLHVFEGNHAARCLCEKAGYSYLKVEKSQDGSLYMFKRIR